MNSLKGAGRASTWLVLWCAIGWALPPDCGGADTFTDDFATKRREWHFLAVGAGKVEVREGVLRLDASSPTTGKLACADLHLAVTPPFTLEWDQNLLRDTRDSYWSGVALWCPWDESVRLRAVLGGQGAKRRWALSG